MNSGQVEISIILPCRNEEKFIRRCLDSIIANDYPKKKLEVLVIDGMSEDRTQEIANEYVEHYPFIKLRENPAKITPAAFNLGVTHARGDLVMIMGAHAVYEKEYISKCSRYLKEYNVDNVGGIWKILPRKDSLIDKAIVLVSSSPFGVGNAYYRIGGFEKPKLVDTVFGGCYKKQVFKSVGLFNEKLLRTQDLDFNFRLRRSGGKILLCPEIITYYFARSDIRSFCRYNLINSFWVTYPRRFLPYMLVSWRHLVPLLFVLSLALTLSLSLLSSFFFWLFISIVASYLLTNLTYSFMIIFREKNIRYIFVIPVIFALLHIGYGLGSLWGLIRSCQKEAV